MVDFFEKRKTRRENGPRLPSVPATVKSLFPILAQLLEGTVDGAGHYETPPFTLTLFAGDGSIRFVVANKNDDEAYFGFIHCHGEMFQEIEDKLKAGDVEEKRRKQANGKPVF